LKKNEFWSIANDNAVDIYLLHKEKLSAYGHSVGLKLSMLKNVPLPQLYT